MFRLKMSLLDVFSASSARRQQILPCVDPEMLMTCASKVLKYLKPTCGEVALEDESDREVEEHVGDPGDPSDPKQLPKNIWISGWIWSGKEENLKSWRLYCPFLEKKKHFIKIFCSVNSSQG